MDRGAHPALEPPAHDELTRAGHDCSRHQRVQAVLGVVPPGARRARARGDGCRRRADATGTASLRPAADDVHVLAGGDDLRRVAPDPTQHRRRARARPAEGAMSRPPLDDVRVVDLSSGISGAYCTKLLADAGADVVKVERPDGDPFRREGPLFALLHTSKRSVAVDPDVADDRALLDALVVDADIVVAGHPHEVEEWLGSDVAALRERAPGGVGVSISWFGADGPGADRAAPEFTPPAWGGSIPSPGPEPAPPGSPPSGPGAVPSPAAVESRNRRWPRAAASGSGWPERSPASARSPRSTVLGGARRARSSTCRRSRR